MRRLRPILLALLLAACGGTGDDTDDGAVTSVGAPTTGAASTTAAPTTTVPTTTTMPSPAEDPVSLAAQVSEAERVLRDPATPPEVAASTGTFQQLAYRRLSAHPEWDAAFFAAVSPDVAPAVANNVAAFRAFQRPPHGTPSDTLPAWRIVPPLPVAELMGYYRESEAATGVPWYYLAAIHLVETRIGRIDGLSTAGAQGPMQFLPTTWAECCTGDIENPRDAIIGAGVYLQRSGAPGDMDRAILRYNRDTRYRDAIKAYAANMAADERAYLGYHEWEVFYASSAGSFHLPVGYEETAPVPVTEAATTAALPG